MSLNQTAYTVNPASSETKTVGATYITATTSTIYTAPSGRNVKVKSFCVSIYNISGTATTDHLTFGLKIGTGQFSFVSIATGSSGGVTPQQFSSDTLGFDGSFLQAADTITGTTTAVTTSGMSFSVSVSLSLEDYAI